MQLPPFWDVTWATWALVGIGTVGTVAALCTLRIIAEQTKAAKASTDALINSERAWVLVDLVPPSAVGTIYDGESLVRDIFTKTTTCNVRILCTNHGSTPAWITEKRACVDVVESLPATPNWDALEIIDPELEPLAVGRKTELQDANLICQKAREDGKMVVVYGIVKYRDVFAPDRTTTFGYRVRVDGVLTRLTGYPEYNRNT
jgi:hypothetical protein